MESVLRIYGAGRESVRSGAGAPQIQRSSRDRYPPARTSGRARFAARSERPAMSVTGHTLAEHPAGPDAPGQGGLNGSVALLALPVSHYLGCEKSRNLAKRCGTLR